MSDANSPVTTVSRGISKNVLRGIVPTVSGFATTTPTDLENATNGDGNSACGVGTASVSAYTTIGSFIFDRGANFKPCMVAFEAETWTNAGNVMGYIDTSADGTIFYTITTSIYNINNTIAGSPATSMFQYIPSRYFRLRFTDTATASSANVILKEVVAVPFFI